MHASRVFFLNLAKPIFFSWCNRSFQHGCKSRCPPQKKTKLSDSVCFFGGGIKVPVNTSGCFKIITFQINRDQRHDPIGGKLPVISRRSCRERSKSFQSWKPPRRNSEVWNLWAADWPRRKKRLLVLQKRWAGQGKGSGMENVLLGNAGGFFFFFFLGGGARLQICPLYIFGNYPPQMVSEGSTYW